MQTIPSCRLCGCTWGTTVLDLGEQVLHRFADSREEAVRIQEDLTYPLHLVQCLNCELFQLTEMVPGDRLYGDFYPYRSSASGTMRKALTELARAVEQEAVLAAGDIVLDIGCNDGYFLQQLSPQFLRIGIEPVQSLVSEVSRAKIATIHGYFTFAAYHSLVNEPAKAITCTAMFYDVPEPRKFARDLSECLAPTGVAVIQMNDVRSLLERFAVDMVSHEHLALYSIRTLQRALLPHLEVYKVDRLDLNGGTMRAWVCHRNARPADQSLADEYARDTQIRQEDWAGQLSSRVEGWKGDLRARVLQFRERGQEVYAYGASTRGNVILQACGLDHTLIAGAADIDERKIGKVMVGTGIPVFAEEEARQKAAALLVLPYSYRQELIAREAEFIQGGGKLIFPLPWVEGWP